MEKVRERDVGGGRSDTRPDHPHAASSPPRPTNPPPNFLLTRLFQIATPPRATATVRYLLNAWHSTTSAPAEGDAFKEEASHMRTAVAAGGLYCVTCYIGFCTLRCTKMDSKKKKTRWRTGVGPRIVILLRSGYSFTPYTQVETAFMRERI